MNKHPLTMIGRLIILLICLLPVSGFTQVLIKGKITDADTRLPVQAASIMVVNGTARGVSDAEGRFEITLQAVPAELKITHVKYQSTVITVKEKTDLLEIMLIPAKQEELKEVTVRSKYYKKYGANTISSALRLKGDLLTISQNIQEITPEILADQGSVNMTENVTRNVSGATRLDISNNFGPYIFMRGGQISTLRNGVDFTPIYRGPVPEDAAIIDRVEFIKGPSLFMNNLGDPAGSFNILTKQATGERKYAVQAQVGSFDFYRLSADIGGKLDTAGKLAYRLNAMGMTNNSFAKFDYLNRYLIAPVIQYNFSKKTFVSFEYTYQYMKYRVYSPTVFSQNGYNTLPQDFAMTDPGMSPFRVNDHTAFLTFNHKLNQDWSFTVRGTMLRNYRTGNYLFARSTNTTNPNIQNRNLNNDEELYRVFSQQFFVNGKVNTGVLTHQLLAGVDVNQKKSYQDTRQFNTMVNSAGATVQVLYPLDITNPVYGTYNFPTYSTPGGIKNAPLVAGIKYYSIYALDEINLLSNKLRLTIGGRYTVIETDIRSGTTLAVTDDKKVTPRIGVSYSVTPTLSVFALYDESLRPQAGLTIDNSKVDPQLGTNQEIGIKKNWFNNRFISTISVYKIRRKNISQDDIANPGFKLLVGEQEATGVDIDVIGEVIRGLNVVANYAYNDSKITNDVNKKLIGTRTGSHVKNIQNTWINYTLPFRKLREIRISAGYQYLGGRYERVVTVDNIGADPKRKTPDYFRVDGAVSWAHKKLSLNLNVNNIFDKKLVGATFYTNRLYGYIPQPPVNFRLAATYNF